jgi:poly [ADP-ribose] polymerase
MGDQKAIFSQAFRVENRQTERAFIQQLEASGSKKTELFWHGSRNENWISILEKGLVLRPEQAVINGKMFGYGLYFADKFTKSLNYTSLRHAAWTGGNENKAYLAVYEVHTGTKWKVKHHMASHYDMNYQQLQKKGGNDSLFAKGGADLVNNEYIIYKQNQCTIRYLVEVKI